MAPITALDREKTAPEPPRDQFGLEVDAIVERNGEWAGIETKLSEAKVDAAADSL